MLWLFKLLSFADFYTPVKGFATVIANDPIPPHRKNHTFYIPYNEALHGPGWNAHDIEDLFKEQGISYWGGQVSNGQFVINVSAEQAQEANYHLSRNGIPLDPISTPPPTVSEQVRGKAFTPPAISRGYRRWTWIPCLQNQRSCRGKQACSDCNQCEDHCTCLGGD